MATIWTEEQKIEMRRLRDEGVSNNLIGQIFGVSGDIVRKVLARFCRNCGTPLKAPEMAKRGVKTRQERLAEHELSAHNQYRALSGAGRPPLRIMPKDFQKPPPEATDAIDEGALADEIDAQEKSP